MYLPPGIGYIACRRCIFLRGLDTLRAADVSSSGDSIHCVLPMYLPPGIGYIACCRCIFLPGIGYIARCRCIFLPGIGYIARCRCIYPRGIGYIARCRCIYLRGIGYIARCRCIYLRALDTPRVLLGSIAKHRRRCVPSPHWECSGRRIAGDFCHIWLFSAVLALKSGFSLVVSALFAIFAASTLTVLIL